jgi:ABC-type uncharacterized transport system ATPase subunit
VRCIGGDKVLTDNRLVVKIVESADEKVLTLAENTDAQTLLKNLIESGATITKFEQIEPSLNDIFIEKVSEQS